MLALHNTQRAARILKRGDGETGEVIQVKDILQFPFSFWLMCIICVAYYVAVFPFIGLALTFYQQKWNLIQSKASTINRSQHPCISSLVSGACTHARTHAQPQACVALHCIAPH